MQYQTNLTRHPFPAIAKAALEMAYANDGVNRDRRERDVIRALRPILNDGAEIAFDLSAIDAWPATLSDEQLLTVVDGEHQEAQALLSNSPPGTEALLSRIFEGAA